MLELAKRENQSKERSFPALNIEIKRRPEWDGLFQPQVDEYTDLVLKEIEGYKNVQISIQSFDPRILRSIHEKDAALPLTYLTEDASQSVEEQLKALSFKPTSFSPHFSMVTAAMVALCKKENVALVVWTVNDEKDIRAMIEMGVTNLISDFPERIIPIRDSLSR